MANVSINMKIDTNLLQSINQNPYIKIGEDIYKYIKEIEQCNNNMTLCEFQYSKDYQNKIADTALCFSFDDLVK